MWVVLLARNFPVALRKSLKRKLLTTVGVAWHVRAAYIGTAVVM